MAEGPYNFTGKTLDETAWNTRTLEDATRAMKAYLNHREGLGVTVSPAEAFKSGYMHAARRHRNRADA